MTDNEWIGGNSILHITTRFKLRKKRAPAFDGLQHPFISFLPRKLHFRIMHLSAAFKCQPMNLLLKYKNHKEEKTSLLPSLLTLFTGLASHEPPVPTRINELDLWVSSSKSRSRVFLYFSAAWMWIRCSVNTDYLLFLILCGLEHITKSAESHLTLGFHTDLCNSLWIQTLRRRL